MAVPTTPTGSDPIRIREVRRSDRDSFSEVMLGSYGPFEAMLGLGQRGTAEFAGLFRPGIWFVLKLLRTFGVAPLRMYVAVEGPQVVGTTMVLPWPNSGYILGVGVRPSHRRRGLAGRMLTLAEQYAGRGGREWAVLDVEEENHSAVTLYRAREYELVQRALWFRTDAASSLATTPRVPATVRVVGRSERKAAANWAAPRVPSTVTRTVPPNPSRLTHFESLGTFPGAARETWSVGPAGAPVGYASASWRGAGLPGMLFFAAFDPSASHDDMARLVQEGTAWLVGRGCTAVVACAPDWMAPLPPVLRELGFVDQLSTLTMARRLRPGAGPASAPKGP